MRRFALAIALAVGLLAAPARPCELCSPPPPEFSTVQAELEAAATVVLADLSGEDMSGRALFVIRDVLRGGTGLIAGQSVAVDAAVDTDGVYLLFGNVSRFDARRPRRIDEDVAAFATLLARVPTTVESKPKEWGARLTLMVPYLSDRNEVIAASAGAEFSAAPFAAVRAAGEKARPDVVLASLQDRGTPVRNRGALALLLGFSGTEKHVPAIEELLANERYRAKPGYDALIAAYLVLRGPEGLEHIRGILRERLELGDARTGVNVLAALRYHAKNMKVLPRETIVAEVRAMLDADALAPAAILELATLEDWDALPFVMTAFRRLRTKGPMVLGPAARFVTECPGPDAEEARVEVMGRRKPPADDSE